MKPLLLTLSGLLTFVLATGAAAHADPEPRGARRSAQSPAKTGRRVSGNVFAGDWDSVEGSFESDGSQIHVSVDRTQRRAYLIKDVGTQNPVRLAPQVLPRSFMRRLAAAVSKARVVTSSSLVVGDTKVESETLRGLLESAALSVEERAEPTEEKVSGKIVETDTGLYLYSSEERFLLRGLRPELEEAASALSEATLQVLRWPAHTLSNSKVMVLPTQAVIVGIYLEATQESSPRGVKPGEPVRVVGVQTTRQRNTPAGMPRTVLKVQNKAGQVGYLMTPLEAGPVKPTTKPRTTKPRATKPRTTKPRATKPRTTKPRTTKPRTTKPRTVRKGLDQALADTKPTDSKSN